MLYPLSYGGQLPRIAFSAERSDLSRPRQSCRLNCDIDRTGPARRGFTDIRGAIRLQGMSSESVACRGTMLSDRLRVIEVTCRMDSRRFSYLVMVLALAAIYCAAAKIGLSLALIAEQVSPVWPPSGIALAAILLLGSRAWPGIAAGAFLANVTAHEPLGTTLGITLGNTLEAVVGAWLLRRVAEFGF